MKHPGRFILILSLCFFFLVCGCTKSAGKGNDSKQTSAGAGTYVKFKKYDYVDRAGIGMKAFSILVPAGWHFTGGIKWVLDNPGMPAVVSFRITNPSGREEMDVFPAQSFFWTNSQMALSTFPIGSRYFGNEVRPPMGALDTLKKIVLPRFRGGVSHLKIVGQQRLPNLAKSLGAGRASAPGVRSFTDGGKIRIEYRERGLPMEEEIFAVVETAYSSMPTMYGTITNTNWVADYLFSFKAEKGKLDKQAKMFQTIAYSFRLNPQWFNKYNQLVNRLVQMQIQRINQIGEISRIISRTNDEISDMIMRSYNERQAVNDRVAENFSEYVRGVDKYQDPIENRSVELPSGYDNAWTNSLGEYILSDSPSFDPNVGSNLNWQRMNKK
jgi:hypothetical protein